MYAIAIALLVLLLLVMATCWVGIVVAFIKLLKL